jgi:transmembrane sensor
MNASKGEEIEAAAANWLARRDRGMSTDEVQAFARWRTADARHEEAVTELELVWGALDDLSVVNGQQRAGGIAAVPPASHSVSTRPTLARWWPLCGLAAMLAIMVGVVVWRGATPPEENVLRFATQIGEQRTVALPDGSTVQLNTNTILHARYGSTQRALTLERGEAYFEVKKDAARPFVVMAGRAEARAVGTAFTVRLRETASEVLVTEGRVRFGAKDGKSEGVELTARQFASLPMKGPAVAQVRVLEEAEYDRRIEWREGRITFSNIPLPDVLAEFGRYHWKQLRLVDDTARELVIGGRVEVANLSGFLTLLEASCDIVVIAETPDAIVLAKRP